MDDIRRQVREAAEIQLTEALKAVDDRIDAKLAEHEARSATDNRSAQPTTRSWHWLGLL
jgi:hypothetical protein